VAWVQGKAEDAGTAGELWSGGLRAYLRHAERLEAEFGPAVGAGAPAPAAGAGTGLFGLGNGAAAAAGLGGAAELPPAPAAPLFGAAPFAFGAAAGSGANPFAAAQPAAAAPGPSAAGAGAEAEEDIGKDKTESVRVTQKEGEETLFSAKAKLNKFVPPEGGGKGGAWNDFGLGVLSVRVQTGDDGKPSVPFVVFRTQSGRLLLTAALYAGIAAKPQKGGKSLIVTLYPSEDADGKVAEPKPYMFLIKVGKPDTAAALRSTIEAKAPAAKAP